MGDAVAVKANSPSKGKKKKYRASLVSKVIGDLTKESPAKTTNIEGILTLTTPCEPQKIFDVMKERIATIPRFKSKYVWRTYKPYFLQLTDEEMDWDYHFRTAFEGEKPSFNDVIALIGEQMKNPVFRDFSKPLWFITVIPELDDGRSVVVTHISHLIGDGVSQVEVLYRMLDEGAARVTRGPGKRSKQKVGFFKYASIFMGGVFEGVFSVLGRPDPPSSLRLKNVKDLSMARSQAFTAKIPIAKCVEIKNKIDGATLNDVFMALLTMNVRKYYEANDEKPRKVTASFPINLRKKGASPFDKHGSPHNVFAYGLMKFDLKYKNAVDLFRRQKKKLDRIKLSPTPVVQTALGSMITPFLPLKGRNDLALNLANKCTVQLSNVPGPTSAVSIAGYELDDLTFQIFCPLGVYLGLITYNGNVSCSVNVESTLVDPEKIAMHWLPAFDELYSEVTGHEGMIKL